MVSLELITYAGTLSPVLVFQYIIFTKWGHFLTDNLND
jgi:hypothetical protein